MLNKNNFAIAELSSKDADCKPEMRALYVAPDRTMVTDGHMAVVVSACEDAQGELFADDIRPVEFFAPFMLDRDAALRVADSAEISFAVIDETTDTTNRATVSVSDGHRQEITRTHKISGKYPNIEAVFPDPAGARVTLGVDPKLLKKLLGAVVKFCNERSADMIEVRLFSSDKPISLFVDGKGQTLKAVLMPMRTGQDAEASAK